MAGSVTLPNTDFPNSAPGVLLPVGTTVVNGFAGILPGETGFIAPDWFEFQGLTPGANFTMTAEYNPFGFRGESGNGESGLRFSLFTNSGTPLFTNQSLETANGMQAGVFVQGIVPSDGFLDVEIFPELTLVESGVSESGISSVKAFRQEPGSTYTVALSAEGGANVPEPGTLAPVGLVLAGALAWSRKRRQ
jgi:hypothetical protein